MKKTVILFLIAITVAGCASTLKNKNQLKWIQLFNGKDLNDWTVKINKHEVNDNFANTFRVENGTMKVSYDGYKNFDDQYGHIFYKKPFSAYYLRVEYRFTGDQVAGGPGWAYRNSGAMLHGQDPNTMLKNQDFPISIEAQLLGGDGVHERTTSNLCTPGTDVHMNGKLFTPHCVNSTSKTYAGDQWVRADFLVLGDSVIHHILEGDTVLTYQKPQMGSANPKDYAPGVYQNGKALTGGFISLQSESHPVEFRKVDLINLEPYMNNKAKLAEVLAKIAKEN